MSLTGQWIGRYSGNTNGLLVLDLDDCGTYYDGTACAWDDDPALPCSIARLYIPSNVVTHHLKEVRLQHVDQGGVLLSPETIARFENAGERLPPSVDVDLSLSGSDLSVRWSTSIGTAGTGSTMLSKSKAGQPSDLRPLPIRAWNRFKVHASSLEPRRYIFRGQSDHRWRLRSSFFRTGRASLERYLAWDAVELERHLSAITKHTFDTTNEKEFAAFINLAQHHGFPTPMLDWTWSPYVAAFFAFNGLPKGENHKRGAKVRVYQFDARHWNRLPFYKNLFPFRPHVSILNALAFDNPRAIPQQAISTMSNVDDIESYIGSLERTDLRYLNVIELDARDRDMVMRELDLMGVNAGSLFPGLDGACAALRERLF
jgi:FRG domain